MLFVSMKNRELSILQDFINTQKYLLSIFKIGFQSVAETFGVFYKLFLLVFKCLQMYMGRDILSKPCPSNHPTLMTRDKEINWGKLVEMRRAEFIHLQNEIGYSASVDASGNLYMFAYCKAFMPSTQHFKITLSLNAAIWGLKIYTHTKIQAIRKLLA